MTNTNESGKAWPVIVAVVGIALIYGILQQPRYVPIDYRLVGSLGIAAALVGVASER